LIPSGLLDLSPFAFFACFVVNYYYPMEHANRDPLGCPRLTHPLRILLA
jgi:hypothetical protein